MMRRLAAALRLVERATEAVGLAVLAFVVVLTAVDVLGRYLLNAPLSGATELTEFGIALIVFSALPAVTWNRGHICVDLLDRYIPERHRARMDALSEAVFAACLAALSVRIWGLGARAARRGEVSEYLSIPLEWIQYYISAICMAVAVGLALKLAVRIGSGRGGVRGGQA